MADPTFIELSNDDTLWVYNASEAEFSLAITDPNKWFDSTILTARPKCKRKDIQMKVNTVNLPLDRRFQLCGICGTGIILANGTQEQVLFPKLEQLAAASTDPETLAELQLFSKNPIDYIDNLDHRLIQKAGLAPVVEVAVDLDLRLGCVHVDFGYFKPFATVVATAAIVHRNEFSQWLANPRFKRLARTVTFFDSSGILAKKDLHPSSKFTGLKAQFCQDPADPNTVVCTAPCLFSSCNVDIGDVTGYSVNDGIVHMDLEATLFKMYCRNPKDNSLCM